MQNHHGTRSINTTYRYVWTVLGIVAIAVALITLEGVKHTNDTEIKLKQVEVQR